MIAWFEVWIGLPYPIVFVRLEDAESYARDFRLMGRAYRIEPRLARVVAQA